MRERTSTNIFHSETSTKVDLFVADGSPFAKQSMDRRQRVQVATDPIAWLYFYTPEDIVLQKLVRYRMGNEISDKRWRDVTGIIVVQAGRLDVTYLNQNAEALGIAELLVRALSRGREG